MHGIEFSSMLYCEPDNYHTLNCDEKSSDNYLISAFNPNIKPLRGVFLSVSREMSKVRVQVLKSQTLDEPTLFPEKRLQLVETEALCQLRI